VALGVCETLNVEVKLAADTGIDSVEIKASAVKIKIGALRFLTPQSPTFSLQLFLRLRALIRHDAAGSE